MRFAKYLTNRLLPFFCLFMILASSLRAVLITSDMTGLALGEISRVFGVGFVFDTAVFLFIAILVVLVESALPAKIQAGRFHRAIAATLYFLFGWILLFSATGEWLFWDEFHTRYNFIAVDYLVYTKEVVGNIRESYPLFELLSAITVLSGLCAAIYYRRYSSLLEGGVSLSTRLLGLLVVVTAAIGLFYLVKPGYADISANRTANQIARNGIYELFSAFRNNELDYDHFYLSRPYEDVVKFIAAKTGGDPANTNPLVHYVNNGKTRGHNLVVITVESLGANFLKEFGNNGNITPNLDDLIKNSLFFDNLHATGTRTVYGLAALTLGTPPVPGNSIVRRGENENLFTIGHVLRSAGYATKFIYGGYGYFDNMNDFFGDNGYQIVDRSAFSDNEVNFANIWGIADDDVYRRALKENDQAFAEGKPFFDMIMTTSNHRPYTFPEGKIDLPSKTGGRSAGVKFTDFAIGEFLREAKKKPWFENTIFVIVADHTAGSAGRTELEPEKYHIPMWIYAPGIVKPGRITKLASQIDVPPTILGLMGISYESKFVGIDLLQADPGRAFISNYQSLGLLTPTGLTILKPGRKAEYWLAGTDPDYEVQTSVPQNMLDEAIGYYQAASQWKSWSRQ